MTDLTPEILKDALKLWNPDSMKMVIPCKFNDKTQEWEPIPEIFKEESEYRFKVIDMGPWFDKQRYLKLDESHFEREYFGTFVENSVGKKS